nr:hypothetical protein [Tanacetum cinerariifolium]
MPFGLKKAGATYQRIVDKVFHDQIGRNLKAYVDDMRKTLKDIQSLNEKITSLSRFLSKGAERSLPFFKVLKSCTDKKNIQWTQEGEAALQEMKKFVEILPILMALVQGKILMMYLSASTESISAALFTKKEEEQVPIYFVSRVLQGVELNYLGMEKLILELVHAARRLRREYLQKTKKALKGFDGYMIKHIRRNQNKKADALCKLTSMTFEHLTKEVLVEVLSKRSIEEKEILYVETKEGESCMTPIHEYLVSGLLPKDPKEYRKIRVKAPQYKLIRGNLTTINGGHDHEARVLLAVNAAAK